MRDDIHKKVPRPCRIQQWVKRAINDADREHGRSLSALADAIADTCQREISPAFRRELVKAVQAPGLFGPLGDVDSPRDLGSMGGHLEGEILSETKRLLAGGHERDTAAQAALAGVLRARVEADIRATAPVLLATQDPKARVVLEHMRGDAAATNYDLHALNVLANAPRVAPSAGSGLDADENLLGTAFAGGRN
jgi:hypothetical protein